MGQAVIDPHRAGVNGMLLVAVEAEIANKIRKAIASGLPVVLSLLTFKTKSTIMI
jgi:hypothetical protein